ncbi:hypothetical protein [Dendronalium sp. ChiSLP03b]|uniref:hypothetical protein n=1 Tax=Dendronalium sp. ChiSLP03b TaxID=3075381 RepID=UPI002AD31EF2|nr:hypothetical protein [Dendronalium sp. ChiSLP03b]MDZ8205466.1 hypothetical protein [Dendronalium sp. ChiSLP03b]
MVCGSQPIPIAVHPLWFRQFPMAGNLLTLACGKPLRVYGNGFAEQDWIHQRFWWETQTFARE